jgi:ABC-2 type transport system ATP-binding protein
MHAIEAHSLTKTYPGGVQAVKGIELEVEPGEVFGLLGPNGAGKSTTVGMLTTTIVPTDGKALVGGYDVVKQPLQARRVSSVVFQEPVVDRSLTGRANLELHARLWGAGSPKRIKQLTDQLGLATLIDRPVESYSGGERRRLEIARALASEPTVLFLDEPTVGLDPRIRHELLDVVAGLRARHELTILVTTHYLDEAQRLADRVAIVHEGAIVALDSPKALLERLGSEILEFRIEGDPNAALAGLKLKRLARDDAFVVGARVTVPLHGRTAAEALAGLDTKPSEITTRVPTLDDVYLELTGARLPEAA